MNTQSFDRRRFLQASAGVGLAGLSVSGLAACGGPATKQSAGVQSAGVKLPTYKPFQKVTPDLPATASGVPAGFLKWPTKKVNATSEKPGTGGTISAMTLVQRLKTPANKNKWLAGLNERLGVTYNIENIPDADYMSKLNARIAGGDLPDITFLGFTGIPRMPDVLNAKFHDLTPFLSGDAVLDYPCLANLPTLTWETVTFNGKIMGIPPQQTRTHTWAARKDILKSIGVEWNPTNADEVREQAIALTSAKAERWAFLFPGQVLLLGTEMFNAPNNWAVSKDGKFTSMYESDEYKQALEWSAGIYSAGVMHPDSFGTPDQEGLFQAGKYLVTSWGGTGITSFFPIVPDIELQPWVPPKASGGGYGAMRLNAGALGPIGISKQDSADRVRELLRVLNWMNSPMGTTEALYRAFGIEGEDFVWKNGSPQATERGVNDVYGEIVYIGGPPYTLFVPGHADFTKDWYAAQQKWVQYGRGDDTVGLYSPTSDQKSAELATEITDVVNDVMRGRKKMSDFDKAVARWKSGGGDQMRGEFEEAYGKAHRSKPAG